MAVMWSVSGYTDKTCEDTSTCSMAGDRVRVLTTDIVDFLKTKDLSNTSIIKIDIEGAESMLAAGLECIANYGEGINVLLSIHPPFWTEPKEKVVAKLLPEIKKFSVFTEKDTPLDLSDLEKMMLDERESGWASKTEMFFAIILKTKAE